VSGAARLFRSAACPTASQPWDDFDEQQIGRAAHSLEAFAVGFVLGLALTMIVVLDVWAVVLR
jgi:heme/copper-type cytochrome/quinol oxidase subunit 4